jgi:hypothetical protein
MPDPKGTTAATTAKPAEPTAAELAEKAAKKAARLAQREANFRKTGNRRFVNVLAAISSFESCSNTANYAYSEAQINRAKTMLDEAVAACWARFVPTTKKADVESVGGIFDIEDEPEVPDTEKESEPTVSAS